MTTALYLDPCSNCGQPASILTSVTLPDGRLECLTCQVEHFSTRTIRTTVLPDPPLELTPEAPHA